MMLITALWPSSIPVSYIFREPSRTRTLLGSRVPVCGTEQREARAEQHHLENFVRAFPELPQALKNNPLMRCMRDPPVI